MSSLKALFRGYPYTTETLIIVDGLSEVAAVKDTLATGLGVTALALVPE